MVTTPYGWLYTHTHLPLPHTRVRFTLCTSHHVYVTFVRIHTHAFGCTHLRYTTVDYTLPVRRYHVTHTRFTVVARTTTHTGCYYTHHHCITTGRFVVTLPGRVHWLRSADYVYHTPPRTARLVPPPHTHTPPVPLPHTPRFGYGYLVYPHRFTYPPPLRLRCWLVDSPLLRCYGSPPLYPVVPTLLHTDYVYGRTHAFYFYVRFTLHTRSLVRYFTLRFPTHTPTLPRFVAVPHWFGWTVPHTLPRSFPTVIITVPRSPLPHTPHHHLYHHGSVLHHTPHTGLPVRSGLLIFIFFAFAVTTTGSVGLVYVRAVGLRHVHVAFAVHLYLYPTFTTYHTPRSVPLYLLIPVIFLPFAVYGLRLVLLVPTLIHTLHIYVYHTTGCATTPPTLLLPLTTVYTGSPSHTTGDSQYLPYHCVRYYTPFYLHCGLLPLHTGSATRVCVRRAPFATVYVRYHVRWLLLLPRIPRAFATHCPFAVTTAQLPLRLLLPYAHTHGSHHHAGSFYLRSRYLPPRTLVPAHTVTFTYIHTPQDGLPYYVTVLHHRVRMVHHHHRITAFPRLTFPTVRIPVYLPVYSSVRSTTHTAYHRAPPFYYRFTSYLCGSLHHGLHTHTPRVTRFVGSPLYCPHTPLRTYTDFVGYVGLRLHTHRWFPGSVPVPGLMLLLHVYVWFDVCG